MFERADLWINILLFYFARVKQRDDVQRVINHRVGVALRPAFLRVIASHDRGMRPIKLTLSGPYLRLCVSKWFDLASCAIAIRLRGASRISRNTRERIAKYPISNCILITGRNPAYCIIVTRCYRDVRIEWYVSKWDTVASGNCLQVR